MLHAGELRHPGGIVEDGRCVIRLCYEGIALPNSSRIVKRIAETVGIRRLSRNEEQAQPAE